MNLHEYQGKQLFAEYGLPVSSEVRQIHWNSGCGRKKVLSVVKAQVHAGGRGKAGGVKLLKDTTEIAAFAKQLGKIPVTYQTDENGQPKKKYWLRPVQIRSEPYLGLWLTVRHEKLLNGIN